MTIAHDARDAVFAANRRGDGRRDPSNAGAACELHWTEIRCQAGDDPSTTHGLELVQQSDRIDPFFGLLALWVEWPAQGSSPLGRTGKPRAYEGCLGEWRAYPSMTIPATPSVRLCVTLESPKSSSTQVSSPTIQASWLGGIWNVSPAPNSRSLPSSILSAIRPAARSRWARPDTNRCRRAA
jgi:hypothetical protein